MAYKKPRRPADAGDTLSVPYEQRMFDPDDLCQSERLSYSDPDHLHVCSAPAGHRYDDGHVCPCGDWWHD